MIRPARGTVGGRRAEEGHQGCRWFAHAEVGTAETVSFPLGELVGDKGVYYTKGLQSLHVCRRGSQYQGEVRLVVLDR